MPRPTVRDVVGWIATGILLVLLALARPRINLDSGSVIGLVIPGVALAVASLVQSRRLGRSWVMSAGRSVLDVFTLCAVALTYMAFSARFGTVPDDPFDSSMDPVDLVLVAILILVAWVQVARYFEIGLFGRRLKPPPI